MSERRAESFLPRPPATLNILLALSGGDLHGYGVKRAIEERTQGRVSMGAGTLYEALRRLDRDGLIEEVSEPPAGEGAASPRWRYYTLTRFGRRALVAELERLERLVHFARERRLLPASGSPT